MARELSSRSVWFATATVVLLAGCYRHPKLDVESLPCTSNDNCPSGSSCDLQTQKCSISGASRSDAGGSESGSNSGAEAGQPSADGPGVNDGISTGEVGVGEAGRIGVDGSGLPIYDGNIDGSSNVPPDAPAGDSPLGESEAGGYGGHTGSGGATGAGGIIGGGGAVGTGGAIVGGGGVVGTGGAALGGAGGVAAGGATGEGGAGPGSGGAGDGGTAGVGAGGVSGTGGASTSPDAAVAGGAPGSGGAVGSGGTLGGTGGTGTGGATGTPADLQASTTTLALGDAPMGESSGEGTFTLTNLGQQTSAPIHLASTNTDFVIRTTGTNTCISDTTTLAQNASCTVRVVLTATSLGSKSGFITFQAGSGASNHVTVSGNGTAGAALSAGTTTTISFPQLATAGVPSPVTSFTITNVGPRTSGTISATSDNADFAVQTGVAGDCTGATLVPNGTCTVRVVMTPSMSGSISGKISVSATPGGTASVNASGTSCAANAHNDGTNNCAPLYTCATNYHNGGTGKCVPSQTCPTDQLTDDTGTCVPMVGVNWVRRSIQASRVAISADGRRLIAANANPSHVYTSANGGQDWTEQTLPTAEYWWAVASSDSGAKLVVVGEYSLYASTDSGSTWTYQSATNGVGYDVKLSADGTLLAVIHHNGELRLSQDLGRTSTRPDQFGPRRIALSRNGSVIYVGGNEYFATSSDFGGTWKTQPLSSVVAVTCSNDGRKVVRLRDSGGLQISSDSGETWQGYSVPYNLSTGQIASSASGSTLIAGQTGSLVPTIVSTDSGTTWKARGFDSNYAYGVAISASGTAMAAIYVAGYAEVGDVYTSTGPVP